MSRFRAVLLVPTVLLGLAACAAYDPPVAGDHGSDKYKADLEACRTSAHHVVYLQAAGDPGTWILSPITSPPKVRAGIRSCMQGKGYALAGSEN